MAQAKPATTDPPPPQSHRTKTDAEPRLKSTRDIEVETVEEDSDHRDQRPDNKRDECLQEHNGMFMEPILEEEANQQEQPSSTPNKPKTLKRPPPPPHPPPDAEEPTAMPTATQASAAPDSPEPIEPPHHPSRLWTTSWTSNLTKGIRQLETWHQRMGHPAPTVLQRTQRAVEGTPKLPDATPLFHCRSCDKAKQH